MITNTEQLRTRLEDHSGALRDALNEARSLRKAIRLARSSGETELYAAHIERLRRLLREHPTAWRLTGDLGSRAADRLVHLIASDDPHVRESVLMGLEALRDSLDYHSSTPLEKLLVDQVALTWLSCEVTRVIYSGLAFRGGEQPEHGRYWEHRLASVEHRLHRAVESLARTRKMVRSTKAVQSAYATDQRRLAEELASDAEPSPTKAIAAEKSTDLEHPLVFDEDEDGETRHMDSRELFLARAKEVGMTQDRIDMYLSILEPAEDSSEETSPAVGDCRGSG